MHRAIPLTSGIVLVLPLAFLLCSCAPKRVPEPGYLHNLGCRIVSRTTGPVITITPLVDVNLDTLSDVPADYTFGATIEGNRRLEAAVRHVNVSLPRDRFNVMLTLDGKTHLRLNHMDLDIYIETTIDDRTYALHCFPEFMSE